MAFSFRKNTPAIGATFILLVITTVFWFLRGECFESEELNVACLSQTKPVFEYLVSLGETIRPNPLRWYQVTFGAGGLFLVFTAALVLMRLEVRKRWIYGSYLLAVLLAILGQYFSVTSKPYLSLFFHLLALLAALLAFRSGKDLFAPIGWTNLSSASRLGISFREIVAVAVLFAAILVTRFFSLNRVLAAWDAETCPHRAVSTSWSAMLHQATGDWVQQSSGLSWPLVHYLFTRVESPDLFLLDERVLGVAISVLSCWVVYFFARWLAGPTAAFLSLSFFAFGALDLGWSRQPTLHNLPVLVALIVVWLTMVAIATKRWRYFIALALIMPLTHFFYPSTRLMFFVPLGAATVDVVLNHSQWRGHRGKFALILIGGALYAVSATTLRILVLGQWRWASPFGFAPGMNDGQNRDLTHTFIELGEQTLALFRTLTYRQVNSTHWDVLTTFEPRYALSSVVVVFAVLAIANLLVNLKRSSSLVLLSFAVAGTTPGLLSEMADRRVGPIFVMLSLLASIEISQFIRIVFDYTPRFFAVLVRYLVPMGVVVVLAFIQCAVYFAEPPYRAMQLEFAEQVNKRLGSDMLVVYLGSEFQCEIFYGMLTRLRSSEGDLAFLSGTDDLDGTISPIASPSVNLKAWYYTRTALREQVQLLQTRMFHKNLLFVMPDTPRFPDSMTRLRAHYPDGIAETVNVPCVFAPLGCRLHFYSASR